MNNQWGKQQQVLVKTDKQHEKLLAKAIIRIIN
jgi:hypothetical protein